MKKYIAVLKTSAEVIRVDKECRKIKLNISVMPVPKKYTSDCGMCLVFEEAKKEQLLKVINMLNLNAMIYEKE